LVKDVSNTSLGESTEERVMRIESEESGDLGKPFSTEKVLKNNI
jgi:hypothetical protein